MRQPGIKAEPEHRQDGPFAVVRHCGGAPAKSLRTNGGNRRAVHRMPHQIAVGNPAFMTLPFSRSGFARC